MSPPCPAHPAGAVPSASIKSSLLSLIFYSNPGFTGDNQDNEASASRSSSDLSSQTHPRRGDILVPAALPSFDVQRPTLSRPPTRPRWSSSVSQLPQGEGTSCPLQENGTRSLSPALHRFFCANNHAHSSGSSLAFIQLSWPTPGYSVYFACPPALVIAAVSSREKRTGTVGSSAP